MRSVTSSAIGTPTGESAPRGGNALDDPSASAPTSGATARADEVPYGPRQRKHRIECRHLVPPTLDLDGSRGDFHRRSAQA
jgi:hypothetical protein